MADGVVTALVAWPLFAPIDTGQAWAITVAAGIGLVTTTCAVTCSLFFELFPSEYRYAGVSLGYNLVGARSGLVPYLTSWMVSVQETKTSMSAIIILAAISPLTTLRGFIDERLCVKDETVVKVD